MDYKAYPVTPYDIIASHPFVVNGYLKTVPTCPNNTNPGGTSYFVNTSSGSNQTFHTGCYGSRHAALGIAPNNPRWDIEHGGVRETEWLP